MNQIDPEAVNVVFLDCLFRPDEIENGKVPDDAVIVEGVIHTLGLHPGRLQVHADEIRLWLSLLPHQFRKNSGGGWSFLNACDQQDGTQWTGLHQRMDQLFSLGIGLGLAKFLAPRSMWPMLPGGMPYVVIEVA